MNRSNAWWALGCAMSLGLALTACNDSVVGGEGGGDDQAPAAVTGESCDEVGNVSYCNDATGIARTCVESGDGTAWSDCEQQVCAQGQSGECTNVYLPGTPEEVTTTGRHDCEQADDGRWVWGNCIDGSNATPLVISFDGAAASFTRTEGNFALAADRSIGTDWVSASTPWLALDRNGNGLIDDGGELFGSATRLASGKVADNGFLALAELDQNHDGVVDAADPAFASLVVWSDENQDRRSQPGELRTLATVGITSLPVRYRNERRCDDRGNCEIETASLAVSDASGVTRQGRLTDVHLRIH